MDLISIIIPVYKVENYLEQCIRSAADQTYKNLEIILVDDGSPDGCPQICDRWKEKEKRIRVIHKPNGGLSDARNEGMKIASGEYIAFVDSDDVLEPEYAEYLYDAVRKTGALVSACQFRSFTDGSEPESFPKKKETPILHSREEELKVFCNKASRINNMVWNKLYHRSLLENKTFAVGFRAQDVLFSCQIYAEVKEIAFVEQPLYNYRIRSGSASDGFIKQRLDAFEMYYRAIDHLKTDFPVYAKELKVYYCSLCIGAADWLKGKKDMDEKNKIFKEIVEARKRICFTEEEKRMCSLKDKLRIFLSSPLMIRPYVCVRRFTGRE